MSLHERLTRLEGTTPRGERCLCDELPATIPWYRFGNTPGCPQSGAQVWQVRRANGARCSLIAWDSIRGAG